MVVNNIAIAETAGTVFSVMLVGTVITDFHKENKKMMPAYWANLEIIQSDGISSETKDIPTRISQVFTKKA